MQRPINNPTGKNQHRGCRECKPLAYNRFVSLIKGNIARKGDEAVETLLRTYHDNGNTDRKKVSHLLSTVHHITMA
jgi:hypothetical protein